MGIMDPISNATHSAIEWAGTKNGILFRIELLVTISVLILTTLVFLGSLRRRSGNPVLKFLLWGSCTISHTVASYTIGLMQSTPFRNELFVIWSTFLLLVLGNADSITAYSLEDNEQQMRTTLNQLLQIIFVATLEERYYAALGSDFRWLFIALFWLSLVKMAVRVTSYQLASRSRGLIGANKLVADYMTYEHELSTPQEVNPLTMSGYKYLITGEETQDLRPTAPHYVKRLQMNDDIITLDKVWQCKGEVLSSTGDRDMKRKDLLLSYALFKLLRRRYGGYPLAECRNALSKTRDLVVQGLLLDVERAFRVIEVELAFLYDFFYTKYPSIFSPGESRATDAFLLVFLLLVVIIWATWSTLLHYKTPEGDENLVVHGFRIDVGLTNTLLFLVMAMESFQLVAVAISDWSKVRLLCTYIRRPSWQKNVYVNRALKQLCKLRLVDTWGKKISKCLLLQDYNYRPTVSRLTRGILDKTREGQKVNSTVTLSGEVKKAVAEALIRSDDGLLTNGRASLRRHGVAERLSWACQLEMHAQTILVWHIATTLCEIEPLRDAGRMSSRQPQADDMKVATDLSGYCAYLVAFVPDLLPDHSFNTMLIFDSVIREARSYLKGCESMRSRFEKMINLADEPADSILKKGARLGREIIEEKPDRTQRWKLLVEFWAELVWFLAPSDDINAHAEMLTMGGEFITHLWALLTHAGFVERPPAAEAV